jgi:hypothetical protein
MSLLVVLRLRTAAVAVPGMGAGSAKDLMGTVVGGAGTQRIRQQAIDGAQQQHMVARLVEVMAGD